MNLPWRDNLTDPRAILLLAAFALALLAAVTPRFEMRRNGVDVLAVVDITGSMNVRDYKEDGKPASRLRTAKAALKDMIGSLPCPSHVGLALFSERIPFLLFEPVDVCRDYGAVAGAIDSIDWREAWQGDSHIASGFLNSVDMAKSLHSDLVFLTDGQEAPPLPATGGPTFAGNKGDVKGLVVGVGGYSLTPIPKYDDRGNEVGFYRPEDVPNESRFGPPPADAESRPGYNARNAPFGADAPGGNEYLSSVREPYLKTLADETGLAYVHLDGPSGLADALVRVAKPRPGPGSIDLRWLPGGTALLCLVAALAVSTIRARTRPTIGARRLQEI